jgi:hypothetical protein
MSSSSASLYFFVACVVVGQSEPTPQRSTQGAKIPTVTLKVHLVRPDLLWWGGMRVSGPANMGEDYAQVPKISLGDFDLKQEVERGMLSALNKNGRTNASLSSDAITTDYLLLVNIDLFRFDRAMMGGLYFDCSVETKLTDRAGKKVWSGGYDPRSSLTMSPLGVRVKGKAEKLLDEPGLPTIRGGIKQLIDKLGERTAKGVIERLSP